MHHGLQGHIVSGAHGNTGRLDGNAQLLAELGTNRQVFGEIGVRTGGCGHAIAPLHKFIAGSRHRRNGITGIGVRHLERKLCLAGAVAIAQGAAAAGFHIIADRERLLRSAGRGSVRRRRTRCIGALGDVGGILIRRRALVLRLVGVLAGIGENGLQRVRPHMDVAVLEIAALAVAVAALQHLAAVQELVALALAHLHQRLVELVNGGHAHIGVAAVVLRNRRNGIHNDVTILICLMNRREQILVLLDEVVLTHAAVGVVGAERHDHPPGLHLGDGIRNGVLGAVVLEGHALGADGGLYAHALLTHKLVQGDQAIVVHAHRVGVAHKHRGFHIFLARILGFCQNGAGVFINLVLAAVVALRRRIRIRAGLCIALPGFADHHRRNRQGHDDRQRADSQHNAGLLLFGR